MNDRGALTSERVRGAAALGLLVVLVVGIPSALVVVGSAAEVHLTAPELKRLLLGPDDGRLFLAAVLGIAWISWLLFALSVGLEIGASLRDMPTPRVPTLRTLQGNVSALVATAGLLFASTHNTGPAAVRPVAAIVQSALITSAPVVQAKPSRPALPTVEVQRHDTLWSVAERHLGSGQRFHEIVTLNLGVRQADGRALSGAHWIYPGWVLQLPADASHMADKPKPPDTYVVRPGDSLSEIAQHELGSADLTQELFQFNAGRVMAGGEALRSPDVIRPGWTLKLPDESQQSSTPKVERQTPRPEVPDHPVPPAPLAVDAPTVSTSLRPAPEAPLATGTAASNRVEQGVGLALGLVTATGLVHELRRRRRQQQRTRSVGTRIPMPEPQAAAAEQAAAALEAPVTVESARRALRELAANCAKQQRLLPEVLLLRLSPSSLSLQLLHDDPGAVPPFVYESPQVWRLEDAVGPNDGDDPYPALLTLGANGPDMLMLNLEATGSLVVEDGTGDAVRALLADLAVGPFSTTAGLAFGDGFGELPSTLDPLRCRVLDHAEQAAKAIIARRQEALDGLGDAPALGRHTSTEGLVPEIVVTRDDVGLPDLAWTGVCHVAVAAKAGGAGASIVVGPSGEATLRPGDVRFVPQSLTSEGFARVLELLAVSQREAQPATEAPRVAVARALPEVPATLLDLGDDVDAPPRLLVLGRIQVERADDSAAPHRRRRVSELVAYLGLHPGATGSEIDEALWPGRRVEKSTRHPFISRARQWLGRNPEGELYLPLVADGGQYRLRPEVSCDWHDFVRFSQLGLDSGRPGASALALAAALDLVRGRPFLGVDPATYTWAEADIQEMISAIVDVAHLLAQMRLEAGDFRGAQHAVARGLLAEPCSELLYRDAMKAAIAIGDVAELDRLSGRLRSEITLIDPDETFDDETIELLASRQHLLR
jgi:LysM repeat protein